MKNVAAIYGGAAPHHRTLADPRFAPWVNTTIYLPDLATTDLSRFDGVIVPDRLHGRLLNAARPQLLDLLERGRTLIVFGEQAPIRTQPSGWLPGVEWEHRPTNFWWWLDKDADSGLRQRCPHDPIWSHISLADATWHQHGVFWPPEGAKVLVSTADGGAVLYVDETSTPGRLVMTTLDPMWHFGSYFMPATERFLAGFFPWMGTAL